MRLGVLSFLFVGVGSEFVTVEFVTVETVSEVALSCEVISEVASEVANSVIANAVLADIVNEAVCCGSLADGGAGVSKEFVVSIA